MERPPPNFWYRLRWKRAGQPVEQNDDPTLFPAPIHNGESYESSAGEQFYVEDVIHSFTQPPLVVLTDRRPT